MTKRFAALASAVTLGMAGFLTGPRSAHADDICTWQAHCRAIMHWEVKAINGVEGFVNPDYQCFAVTDTSVFMLTSEMWVGLDTDGARWVEAGDTVGKPWGTAVHHFWAEGYDGDYHEHSIGVTGENFSRSFSLDLDSDRKWRVREDGVNMGTATVPGVSAINADVGMESTDPHARAEADIRNLTYTDTKGSVHNGWNSASYHPKPFTRGGFAVGWITPYTRLAVNSADTCYDLAKAPEHNTPSEARPATPGSINTTLRSLAKSNGEPSPGKIETTETSEPKVQLIGKRAIQKQVPVTVVQTSGNFIGYQARVPAGNKLPHGKFLTMTIETSSGDLLDWGISSHPINLSIYGAVQTIR
ncbi:hypothetical protein NE235_21095 [Actinoallomurus spadix]|uniref:Uncharacterized protein n=1 Tax=Actinoallomurus spadix TaxID=79912 RepID=A0ABP3G3I2_9ACTN|nr:hypothetical protein [Actinoallomurus spadix]MCO5988607.1 hypothetical protein [Actinoallomurus spadix]